MIKKVSSLDRRQFLMQTAAALIAAHPMVRGSLHVDVGKLRPRIDGLTLFSSASVDQMKAFYGDVLGLPIVRQLADSLTIASGDSRLTFQTIGPTTDRPFYHFAFNIPENKIRSALEWQKKRTPILPIPEHLQDPKYPNEVVNFSHWNAHSVFFLDPAGNVVEYIARHDLDNGGSGTFSSRDILYPSEIGIIVDDVLGTVSKLKTLVGIDQYKGGGDEFTALGDEYGLLLVMKRGRILNFNHSSQEKAARVYGTSIHVHGARSTTYSFPDFPYEVFVDECCGH